MYDAENRYVKLGTTLVNTYDGQSLRVEKVTGGSTTVYVFSGMQAIAEYTPTAQVTAPSKEYIYSGGQLLATLDASHNPTYRNPDLLSARLFTDASGNSIGTQGHLPFGESWYSTGTVDKWKFTSYERDTDTNLDYARMRFNSGRLARFMSPDPYAGSIDIGNPQSWNRYAYVINDPLNFIDPTGLGGEPGSGNCDVNCILHNQNDDQAVQWHGMGCGIEGMAAPCSVAEDLVLSDSAAKVVCDGWSGCGNITVKKIDGEQKLGLFKNHYYPDLVFNCYGESYSNPRSGGCYPTHNTWDWIADVADTFAPGSLADGVFHHPIWRAAANTMNKATKYYAYAFMGVAGLSTASSMSTMEVAVGEGSPFHVAFGADGVWLHAAEDGLGGLEITTQQAAAFARGYSWIQFSVPVLNTAAVLGTAGQAASSCVSAACYAFIQGWIH